MKLWSVSDSGQGKLLRERRRRERKIKRNKGEGKRLVSKEKGAKGKD